MKIKIKEIFDNTTSVKTINKQSPGTGIPSHISAKTLGHYTLDLNPPTVSAGTALSPFQFYYEKFQTVRVPTVIPVRLRIVQDSLLVKSQTDNHLPGPVPVPASENKHKTKDILGVYLCVWRFGRGTRPFYPSCIISKIVQPIPNLDLKVRTLKRLCKLFKIGLLYINTLHFQYTVLNQDRVQIGVN